MSPNLPTGLQRVSITGADDNVDIGALHALGAQFPWVEWALLYVPRPGGPRNPTHKWRQELLRASAVPTAVHLCFRESFEQLLEGRLSPEVVEATRIQLNVNARRVEFTEEEVLSIYRRSLDLGPDIIVQHQSLTAPTVARFLEGLVPADRQRVHVLVDESRGKGVAPAKWGVPDDLQATQAYVGFAGGMNPTNVQGIVRELSVLRRPFWIDMETGVRTDDAFDLDKVRRVLEQSASFVNIPAF